MARLSLVAQVRCVDYDSPEPAEGLMVTSPYNALGWLAVSAGRAPGAVVRYATAEDNEYKIHVSSRITA